MFTIMVQTGNADFADNPAEAISCVLDQCKKQIAEELASPPVNATRKLLDRNGNEVGYWTFMKHNRGRKKK